MANPTSNFNWQMPTNTDLVKDLPADFEVFGQAVDTAMADLLGGTSGQILAKNSNTNMDFVWINNDQGDITAVTAGTGISGGGTTGAVTITNSMATEITAKGDLIVGTGNAAFDNLPAGTNGHVLTADSTVSPTGLKWAAPAGGKVLQVVGATTTTATTIASATLTDTGITASITPTASNSKVLILITAEYKQFRNSGGFTFVAAELLRDATTIADYDKTDHDEFAGFQLSPSTANAYQSGVITLVYLDSPATTSSTTYKLQARGYDANVSITFQQNSAVSTITLLEIGA